MPTPPARAGHETPTAFEPKIIAFVCNWCTYTGRRPGRHEPPADGAQRADHPPALHRPHRPALHHQGVRARRRRRHRLAAATRPTATTPPATTTRGAASPSSGSCSTSWASTRSAITFSWVSASEGRKWRDVVNDTTAASGARAVRGVSGTARSTATYPRTAARREAARCRGAAGTRAEAALRRHGRGRHRLGGRAARRAARLRHRRRPRPDRLIFDQRCVQNLATYLLAAPRRIVASSASRRWWSRGATPAPWPG